MLDDEMELRHLRYFSAVAGELSLEGIKVHKLAIFELPRSGKPEELLAKYGIDANAIIDAAESLTHGAPVLHRKMAV